MKLDSLLAPGAGGVTVGCTAELEMTGVDGLGDAPDAGAELRGSGVTTV